jgi:CRP/FNR family transcriptional regulator
MEYKIRVAMENDLHKIHIFSTLPENVVRALQDYLIHTEYIKGAMILWAQDECKNVYFVLSGMVEIFHLSLGGREQTVELIKPGESFNLVPVFMPESLNQVNARAQVDSQILSISKKKFLQLLEEYPQLSKTVAEYFAMRLTYMVGMVESLALHSVRQRMAAFLVKQADKVDPADPPRWTQEEMARQLGTVRDVVGRILRKLENDGLIRFQRQRIQLLDREALEEMANDNKNTTKVVDEKTGKDYPQIGEG